MTTGAKNPFDPRAVPDETWAKVRPGEVYCWDPGDGDLLCKRKPSDLDLVTVESTDRVVPAELLLQAADLIETAWCLTEGGRLQDRSKAGFTEPYDVVEALRTIGGPA